MRRKRPQRTANKCNRDCGWLLTCSGMLALQLNQPWWRLGLEGWCWRSIMPPSGDKIAAWPRIRLSRAEALVACPLRCRREDCGTRRRTVLFDAQDGGLQQTPAGCPRVHDPASQIDPQTASYPAVL